MRLERDAAQHLVRPQSLFEAIDPDRHPGHFFLVTRLVAVDVGLPPLAAGLAAFLAGAGFGLAGAAFGLAGAAFGLAGAFALTGAAGSTGSSTATGASAATGSADATRAALDRVRWQVSQVTMLRTRVPSWCSSRRRLRGRPQNEQ